MCLQPSVWRVCVGGVSPACGVKTLMHSWGREHSSLLGFGHLFICFKMIWGLSGRVPPSKKTSYYKFVRLIRIPLLLLRVPRQ